jgi:hypothetical protein
VDSAPVTVVYDPALCEYGYHGSGGWVSYDALDDAAVVDGLMRSHGYYYGPVQTYSAGGNSAGEGAAGGESAGSYSTGGYSVPSAPSVFVHQASPGGEGAAMLVGAGVLAAIIVIFVKVIHSQSRAPQISQTDPMLSCYGAPPPLPRPATMAPPPLPPRKTGAEGAFEPAFWQSLRIGAIVTLSDELAMKDALEKTGKAEGVAYVVQGIRRVQEARGLGQWVMLQLQGSRSEFQDQHLWFVAKVVGDKLSLLVYEPVKDLAPGNRKDYIDRGLLWAFQKPDDPDPIVYTRLRYTMDILRDVDAPGGRIQVRYVQKAQGELQGTCVAEAVVGGATAPLVATVVEYVTDQECDNPELMLVEIGSDGPEGGSITLMEGGPIPMAEVDVT